MSELNDDRVIEALNIYDETEEADKVLHPDEKLSSEDYNAFDQEASNNLADTLLHGSVEHDKDIVEEKTKVYEEALGLDK